MCQIPRVYPWGGGGGGKGGMLVAGNDLNITLRQTGKDPGFSERGFRQTSTYIT